MNCSATWPGFDRCWPFAFPSKKKKKNLHSFFAPSNHSSFCFLSSLLFLPPPSPSFFSPPPPLPPSPMFLLYIITSHTAWPGQTDRSNIQDRPSSVFRQNKQAKQANPHTPCIQNAGGQKKKRQRRKRRRSSIVRWRSYRGHQHLSQCRQLAWTSSSGGKQKERKGQQKNIFFSFYLCLLAVVVVAVAERWRRKWPRYCTRRAACFLGIKTIECRVLQRSSCVHLFLQSLSVVVYVRVFV